MLCRRIFAGKIRNKCTPVRGRKNLMRQAEWEIHAKYPILAASDQRPQGEQAGTTVPASSRNYIRYRITGRYPENAIIIDDAFAHPYLPAGSF
jgi:hypothetical protein